MSIPVYTQSPTNKWDFSRGNDSRLGYENLADLLERQLEATLKVAVQFDSFYATKDEYLWFAKGDINYSLSIIFEGTKCTFELYLEEKETFTKIDSLGGSLEAIVDYLFVG
jgi:hypothetical protein